MGHAANEIAHVRLGKELMSLMADAVQYDPPLFAEGLDGQLQRDRLSTCSALIDWADPDEQLYSCDVTNAPSSNAVEDSWYQLLQKPYRRKNAPYDSLEELHMVRGISDDFWAAFGDPDPTNPKKRGLTVWGQGTVNVNSANHRLTLYAVVRSGAPTSDLVHRPHADAALRHGRHHGARNNDGRPALWLSEGLHPDDGGQGLHARPAADGDEARSP